MLFCFAEDNRGVNALHFFSTWTDWNSSSDLCVSTSHSFSTNVMLVGCIHWWWLISHWCSMSRAWVEKQSVKQFLRTCSSEGHTRQQLLLWPTFHCLCLNRSFLTTPWAPTIRMVAFQRATYITARSSTLLSPLNNEEERTDKDCEQLMRCIRNSQGGVSTCRAMVKEMQVWPAGVALTKGIHLLDGVLLKHS